MKGQEQQAKTETQEVPSEHEEKNLYCESDKMVENTAKRTSGVSFSGHIQNYLGCDPVQCALGHPTCQGGL